MTDENVAGTGPLSFEAFKAKYLKKLISQNAEHELNELNDKDLRDFYKNYEEFAHKHRNGDFNDWVKTFED